MKNVIFCSFKEGAGKTSLIVGLAKAMGREFGYMKPFGDRLTYRKKRLWDYDTALITNIFGLELSSEEMTIGFEHSKLRYMYDESSIKEKLLEIAARQRRGDGPIYIEAGGNMTSGASVFLDALSLAKYTGGKLIIIASGDEGGILDDITFLKKYVATSGLDFGIIINKVSNVEDYRQTHLPEIKQMGIKVLGVVPYIQDLTYVTVSFYAERLQAHVLGGEQGLNQRVKYVFVGAMAGDTAARLPLFKKENKLAITGGDRADMIVAALESNTSGIILTNNILPPHNIIAKASDRNIPLLLVPFDTFEAAKQIEKMTPLLTRDDNQRIDILKRTVEQNIDIQGLVKG
jgi:BioD-like phosphotransacetylase family protein